MRERIEHVILGMLMLMGSTSLAQESDSTLSGQMADGIFSAQVRTFFMATVNDGALKDYDAFAIGAGLGYESPEIKRFKVSISGFFIQNVASSDLASPDPIANMINRYELGLFDLADAGRKQITKIENLYIQYRISKSYMRAGRFSIVSPFINPQDGRMRPTFEQGFWTEINELKNTRIFAGWLTHISPRSTSEWYKVRNIFGIYPVGVNEVGTRSGYAGNTETNGVGLLGAQFKRSGYFIAAWNTLMQNVSNTSLLQLEKEITSATVTYYGGLQYVRQDALNHGGNADPAKAYIKEGTFTNTFSGKVGVRNQSIDVNVNATRISDGGRFLMPREWGRDPFYTFMPRERNEGYGNVKAISLNVSYSLPRSGLKSSIGIGHFDLPDVLDFRLNKYSMPSYSQLNAEVQYSFHGFLKGTNLQFLYVYKQGTGEDYENPKNIMNKVDMSNFNLVLNYRFQSSHSQKSK